MRESEAYGDDENRRANGGEFRNAAAAQELEDQRARRASIDKWEGFCKPQRTYDSFGVGRLVYAHKGCEYGRSE